MMFWMVAALIALRILPLLLVVFAPPETHRPD
jgi:hypothetical protein